MTYCLGWKYGGSAYLIADSAATGLTPPYVARSSFDELHDNVRGEYVQESLLKIVRLSDKCAAAYSGDVATASNMLSVLKQRLEFGGNIQDALNAVQPVLVHLLWKGRFLFSSPSMGSKEPA